MFVPLLLPLVTCIPSMEGYHNMTPAMSTYKLARETIDLYNEFYARKSRRKDDFEHRIK